MNDPDNPRATSSGAAGSGGGPVRPFEIAGSGGLPVRGDVHVPAGRGPHPVVVGVHGFKGFRRWGFWPYIAAGLAERGIACVRYDASHNGVGAGGLDFDEPHLFERNTWGREEHDLDAVLRAVRRAALPGLEDVDAARLGLIGHSRGGGLVVVRTAADPAVRAAVVLAPVATTLRFAAEVLERARRAGFAPIVNTRTGEILRFGQDALDELDARTDLHDIAARHAARISVPLLVAHGTLDAAVAPDEGRRIAAAARGRFEAFAGADHVLGCRHPWQGPTPDFGRFLDLARAHFAAHLAAPAARS